MKCYTCNLAGIEMSICFQFPKTATYYKGLLNHSTEDKYHIMILEEDILYWQKRWAVPDPSYVEYVLSCSYICDYLMSYDRMVFHGASFLWNDQAYIFSAPSGTGKTTQLMHWKSLFPNEVEILNGDKPILEIKKSGRVYIHPSPWKGKENMGRDDIVAPLGGIILLRQDKENCIDIMTPAEAAKNLFGRSYSTFGKEQDILNVAHLLERLLLNVPVWVLRNKGDKESAIITHQALMREGY